MNSTWLGTSDNEIGLENISAVFVDNNNNDNSTFADDSDQITLQFPLYIKIWVSLASGIIFVIGVGGNILVPIVVWKNKQMRHSTNIFLLNLALADCLILLICLPTALVELYTIPNTWNLGAFLCHLVPFIEITVTRASVFTLTVISVERYIAICKPLRANSVCTRPRAFVVSLAIWPMSFLAAGPVIVATDYYPPSPSNRMPYPTCITSLHYTWVAGYYLGSAFVFFICPLFFLSGIYFFIARTLLSHRARSNRKIDNVQWNARKQVAMMLGAVVIIFFVCLLPFQILIVWVIQTPAEVINNLDPQTYFNILFACRVLVYINAAANPIVYNAMSAKFRKALLKLFIKEPKKKTLRRRSTITTMFSSSSTASSRSNSFRRLANLVALKRSFSDASIRRQGGHPRLSSPSVFTSSASTPSSPKGHYPLLCKTKEENPLEKWFLKKGTSGSYFSGGDSLTSLSTLAFEPQSPKFNLKMEVNKHLLFKRQNGCPDEWNRSLPDLFPSSPGSAKRVSFKDATLPKERPRAISPLTFNSERGEEEISPNNLENRTNNSNSPKRVSKFSKTIFPKKKSKKFTESTAFRDMALNEIEIQKLNSKII